MTTLAARYAQLNHPDLGNQRALAHVTVKALKRLGSFVEGMKPRKLTAAERDMLHEDDFA